MDTHIGEIVFWSSLDVVADGLWGGENLGGRVPSGTRGSGLGIHPQWWDLVYFQLCIGKFSLRHLILTGMRVGIGDWLMRIENDSNRYTYSRQTGYMLDKYALETNSLLSSALPVICLFKTNAAQPTMHDSKSWRQLCYQAYYDIITNSSSARYLSHQIRVNSLWGVEMTHNDH